MLLKHLAVIPVLACLFAPAFAQAEEELIARFMGEWHASGTSFGMPAETTMEWQEALGSAMARLDFTIEMTPASGPVSTFTGIAYYSLAGSDGFDAFWADNSGEVRPITTRREGDALISDWGGHGGEQGQTRYELLPSGEMEVTDWVLDEDEWRQFNHNVFMRMVDG